MRSDRLAMAWINVIGGLAVLGSYAHGLIDQATRAGLWGGVPGGLRPLYTVSMFVAAAGYLTFTFVLYYLIDPETRVGSRPALRRFNALYLTVLVPSALWLPLTAAVIATPGALLWLSIRLVLLTVGLGAIGMVVGLVRMRPRPSPLAYGLAVAGSVAFAFQTAVLDAVVWPAFYPHP